MKAAIYARVSTTDQTCENQLLELRRYAEARGWTVTREAEYPHLVSRLGMGPRGTPAAPGANVWRHATRPVLLAV